MSSASAERERRELLIATIAGLLDGVCHVAVGASSPIPAAGAMLLRARNEATRKPPVRITILGSKQHNFFTNGSVELFDCAAQGRRPDIAFQASAPGRIKLSDPGDQAWGRLIACQVSPDGKISTNPAEQIAAILQFPLPGGLIA